MYDLFLKTAREIFEEAKAQKRLHYNPDYGTLKKWFAEEPDVRRTRYGSLEVDTEPTSRLARFTKNNIDEPFGPAEEG